jgi:hypothetical protein
MTSNNAPDTFGSSPGLPFCGTSSGSQSVSLIDDSRICQTLGVPRQSRGLPRLLHLHTCLGARLLQS